MDRQPPGAGELQFARSEVIQAWVALDNAIINYQTQLDEIDDKVDEFAATYNLNVAKLATVSAASAVQTALNVVILVTHTAQLAFKRAAEIAPLIADAAAENVPTVTGVIAGFSNGIIMDGLAPARGGIEIAGTVISQVLGVLGDVAEIVELGLEHGKELNEASKEIAVLVEESLFAEFQALKELEVELRDEGTARTDVFLELERLQQAQGQYLNALARGVSLLERRDVFRRQVAADIQMRRYKDMAFRVFRNDALQKYRAQYDMAARYVYLAAKAYDYETTLLSDDAYAGEKFLAEVVRARQIGTVEEGLPQTGEGLADILARMSQNWSVLFRSIGLHQSAGRNEPVLSAV